MEDEPRTFSFAKIQALGHDFIWILDRCSRDQLNELHNHVPVLAERKVGIGADGVIFWQGICGESIPLFFYNSDGSFAEICGNALRALAISGRDMGLFSGGGILIFEMAGERYPVELPVIGARCAVGLGMGSLECSDEMEDLIHGVLNDNTMRGVFIRMPNPHIVVLLPGPTERRELDVHARRLASIVQGESNVGFFYMESSQVLLLDVWERGVGWTDACGSGAAAAWSVAHHFGLADEQTTVRQRGGSLEVTRRSDGRIWIFGEAALVYRGSVKLNVSSL